MRRCAISVVTGTTRPAVSAADIGRLNDVTPRNAPFVGIVRRTNRYSMIAQSADQELQAAACHHAPNVR